MAKTKVQFKEHAQDDFAKTSEKQFVVIDVLANDRGSASTIYSLDQEDPTNEFRFAVLPSGATVQTTGIQHMVVYKPGNGFDYLAEGETATDSFTYTIRLADGSFSTATIEVLITGTNDPAQISPTVARLTEGDSADDISSSGTLAIFDPDGPESFFPTSQTGLYGTFTLEEDGDWTYVADGPHDEFAEGKRYNDGFLIEAADGTKTTFTVLITGTAEPEMLTADPMAFL